MPLSTQVVDLTIMKLLGAKLFLTKHNNFCFSIVKNLSSITDVSKDLSIEQAEIAWNLHLC